MAEEKVIWVYGPPEGWKPPTKKEFHGETYLEYAVPKKLEKELSKMIEKRLKQFYRECKCKRCKENKKRKK